MRFWYPAGSRSVSPLCRCGWARPWPLVRRLGRGPASAVPPEPTVRHCRAPPACDSCHGIAGVLDSRFPCLLGAPPMAFTHSLETVPVRSSSAVASLASRWLGGPAACGPVLRSRQLHPCSVWDLDRGACITGRAARQATPSDGPGTFPSGPLAIVVRCFILGQASRSRRQPPLSFPIGPTSRIL